MQKVETLENIIADKLRAISDLDLKLKKTRKSKQSNSVDPQPTFNYYPKP